MKRINDSYVGMAILGGVFLFFAVAYARVHEQRTDAQTGNVPVEGRVVKGIPALLRGFGRPGAIVTPASTESAPAPGSAGDMLNRARVQLNAAHQAVQSPVLRTDPRLDETRKDIESAIKELDSMSCENQPQAVAKTSGDCTAG